jgi:superfamily II DNA or RNA helicase
MLDQNIRQNALQKAWERKNEPQLLIDMGEFSSMRGWQIEAFNELKDASRMILNAPMGSGKSWLMCLLSAYKMNSDPTLRSIICVPQIVIAAGFVSAKIMLPDGTKIDWQIKNNLCSEEASKSKVGALIQWLEKPLFSLQDRVLLCSHTTLLKAYRKLQREGSLDLLDRLLIWIDEAHHLMNTASEDFPAMVENNGIGKVIEYLLSQADRNIQIGLTTATCFRGDRLGLLTQEMKQKFKPYLLPYDKYLASMEHLESFNFDFLICGHNYIKGIELLMQQRRGKDIIYIPHPNSTHSQGKHREVNNILNMYHGIHGGEKMRSENGLIHLGSENNSFKVIDLVDDHPHKRSQGKNFIANPILKKEREALDAIIALNMFKEGADWIWADRCIIVGIRSSLVDIIQMVGRVLRDAKAKKHVEVIQLLPFFLDQTNASVFRDNLNDYLKAIYASLILENILDPVQIKLPSSSGKKENQTKDYNETSSNKTSEDWLSVVIPDAATQHTLLENISTRLMSIKSEKTEHMSLDEHQKIICNLLEKEGISEHKEEISWQIIGMWTRKTMKLQGISVSTIDFDIVQIGEPLEFLLTYTSGACNVDTFQKLRDAIQLNRSWRPFEEAKEWVTALKLTSETQWRIYISGQMPHLPCLPEDIPRAPWVAYKDKGWITWGDFLGTNMTAPRLRKYRSYEEAQAFAHSLKLKRKEDWPLYVKGHFPDLPPLPSDIAACPDKTYRRKDYGQKWSENGWGDFLGTGRVSNKNKAKKYLAYEEGKAFVQPLKLKSSGDWRKYIRGEMPHLPPLPQGMPKKPDQVYENFEWSAFLGAEISKMNSKREFWSFEKAKNFIKNLGLKSFEDWIAYCASKLLHLPEKPLEIPSNPQKKYKDSGWQGYADWMGY